VQDEFTHLLHLFKIFDLEQESVHTKNKIDMTSLHNYGLPEDCMSKWFFYGYKKKFDVTTFFRIFHYFKIFLAPGSIISYHICNYMQCGNNIKSN